MNFLRKTVCQFAVVLLVLPLSACAYSGGPAEGTVLEEGTHKPIPGAIVVVRWEGIAFSFAHTQSVCIHVESALTDDKGHFRIPAWRASVEPAGVHNLQPLVTVYKSNYRQSEHEEKNVQYLQLFTGGSGEQLRKTAAAAVTCGSAGASKKNLLPLYRTIYEDARPLAVTKEDKYILSNLLFKIEELELPYEEAEKRHVERHNVIYREK